METPSSGTMGSSVGTPTGTQPVARSSAPIDRYVRRFLTEEFLNYLHRRRQTALAQALRATLAGERGGELGRLPARLRAELLETIERWINEPRSSTNPRAIVRLVSAVVPIPTAEESLGRWRSSPAR